MLTLSLRDRDWISVLRQVTEGRLPAIQGAKRLGVTPRHFRRMRRRWELEGDASVLHGGRGAPSNRRLPPELRERARKMASDPMYEDFGPTLLSEHLARDPDGGAGR